MNKKPKLFKTQRVINPFNFSCSQRRTSFLLFTFFVLLFSSYIFAQEKHKKDFINDRPRHNKTNKAQSAAMPNSPQATGDTVSVKDNAGNVLMTVTDEGNAGSIKLNDAGVVSPNTNKLYNNGGSLYWNGSQLSTGGSGATQINDLTDAKYDGLSLFLGEGAGANDDAGASDGVKNYNTAVGKNALHSNTTGYDNTANGYQALFHNTSGEFNTANGKQALVFNTTGHYNIGVGKGANYYNQEGSRNTIIGYLAGKGTASHNKSGNIFLGYKAGFYETGDNKLYIQNDSSSSPLIWGDFANNIAAINGKLGVGTQNPSDKVTIIAAASGEVGLRVKIGTATKFKVEENGGVAIGVNYGSTPANGLYVNGIAKLNNLQITTGAANGLVLTSDASGNASWQASSGGGATEINDLSDGKTTDNSLYVGSTAGEYDDGGANHNTGVGIGSLSSESLSGSNGKLNSAVGYFSLNANNSGNSNTANGYYALGSNATGDFNTAIGRSTAALNTSGERNVAIGAWSNLNNTTGSNNTMIGYEAGRGTGSTGRPVTGNVFIGYQAGGNETTDNKLFIENSNSSTPLIWGDFSTDSIKINGNLNVSGNITTDATYSVGDYAQGGYVFEVSSDGKHGLVVTLNDQTWDIDWYNMQESFSNASKHTSFGGLYKDWRFPTRRELSLIFTNKVDIDAIASSHDGEAFGQHGSQPNVYWTGLTNHSNTGQAYVIDMSSGVFTAENKINPSYSVRTVRAF